MKIRKSFIALLIPVFIITGIACYHIKPTAAIVPQADWKDNYSSVDDLIAESDIILSGKVIDSMTEQRFDLIFTNQEIVPENVFKGELVEGQSILVLQTGGEMNGIKTLPFAEAPLLEKDCEYVMFLEDTGEGYYLILGGYQGLGEVVNGRLKFSNVKSDEISRELTGKTFSAVVNILDEQIVD